MINQEKLNIDFQNELNCLQEIMKLINSNQDPPVDLYHFEGSDKVDNKIDSLIKEPLDTLLMGDEVISTIPAKETNEFIKSSVDDLVLIPRDSEVTSDSDLECDMPATTPLPTIDVREENLEINLPLGEHLDTLSTGDREIDFNPSREIEERERLLADDRLPVLRVFDEPLGDDTKPRSYDVIVNGDAPAIASASVSIEGPIPPKTVEQKLARKNELKAKSTLLMAIPDEHLLKFHGIRDAKTLWKAIKDRSEGQDKTYDRFQKLISQLEIHGEVISQEDVNLKLLRSLPSAWNNIALIMRNKSDLDTLSMDDLYNNLKVYESEIKGQSSSNSQNVAFVTSENTSSTNEAGNIAHEVSTASSQGQDSSSTYANDVMFSFFANQSNSSQLDNEDLEQIDTNDLKEMDLK
ncbi:hypothetical protein Tco_0769107 [Tanacetum coccineum]|uniref:Uncharacterized protein n=1 Tax=Tanacetum coccineum TaxID=301880 RepID=A0ABQ4ZA81_9ASTR